MSEREITEYVRSTFVPEDDVFEAERPVRSNAPAPRLRVWRLLGATR